MEPERSLTLDLSNLPELAEAEREFSAAYRRWRDPEHPELIAASAKFTASVKAALEKYSQHPAKAQIDDLERRLQDLLTAFFATQAHKVADQVVAMVEKRRAAKLLKGSEDQPRDDHGRWEGSGGFARSDIKEHLMAARSDWARTLLERGQFSKPDRDTFAAPRMQANTCYTNAREVALKDPALSYVEGVVHDKTNNVFAHAWNMDSAGRVVDRTARGKIDGYFGIKYDTSDLRTATVDATGLFFGMNQSSKKMLKEAPERVILIRHAEKPEAGPHLSAEGKAHAQRLAETIPAKYGVPDVVFAAANTETSHRCVETAEPLVARYHLRFEHDIARDQIDAAAGAIRAHAGELVLVVWPHETLPALAGALDGKHRDEWSDDDFSTEWEITLPETAKVAKGSDDEPRDDRGRWTSGGGDFTKEDRGALDGYTGDKYFSINRDLRDGIVSDDAKAISVAISHLPQEQGTFYRGTGEETVDLTKITIGTEFADASFLSCSKSDFVATHFATTQHFSPLLFRMTGTAAALDESTSKAGGGREQERIFQPGTRFGVTGIGSTTITHETAIGLGRPDKEGSQMPLISLQEIR